MTTQGGNRRVGALLVMLVGCGLTSWCETHHRMPAFRAWSFGGLFVLIAGAAVLTRGMLRNTAVVLATLALGLCGLEFAAGLLQPKGGMGGLTIAPRWLVARPVVGFGFDQAMVIHAHDVDPRTGALIFDARYTIGATFDRVVKSADGGPATVFFGDSFTFGEGLNDDDTLPERYADLSPGKRVLNLAITGYSPQQFLREVQTSWKDGVIGPKPKAFIFLTSPFHAMRTAYKESWTSRAPRYTLVNSKVTYQGACYEGAALLFQDYLENSALYRMAVRPFAFKLTHADVDLYIKILADAARLSREKYGVDTLVPFVRTKSYYLAGTGWDNDSIIAALKAQGVRVVDMTLPEDPDKGFTIRGNGHPTANANAIRARWIADILDGPAAARTASTPR